MEREESGTRTVNDKEMTSLVHMETIEERGDLLNQQCSNCDGNLARHWCLDCYEALCGDCVTAHRRVTLTRSHRLLNQPCNDDRFRPPIKFCKLHPPEPLRLFCFTCNHLTCRDCQLLAHKNHRFSFASEAVDGLRKKLDACMQPIRAQMEASRKSLQDMEMRLKVLARSELHLTNSLQEVFRSLSELLKARLERLTREIQTIYDLEREMIKGRMLKVKELQEGHRSVREAADKAQNSRDLLVVLRCVEQVTSQVKDLKDQDLSPPSNMVYLKVTTDRQTVESMIRFGKLLLSWVPFCVSKEFKESVEPHPASSTSSPTSQPLTSSPTSQPLTSSIIQPLMSSSISQPLTSSSIIQPLTSSSTSISQPLTSSSIIQPLTSSSNIQPLTSSSIIQPLTSSSTSISQPLTSSSISQPLTSSSISQPLTSSSISQPLTSSSTSISQPLTSSSIIQPLTSPSTSISQPLTSSSIIQPLTSSSISQPLTSSSIIQPLTSSSISQPLTSSSISQPLTSSPTSQPLTSSSISQPLKSSFINQLLTSTSKTSNGISGPASCPVSLTTSSSLDSSNLLTFSSKIIPQTGTSREAASNQQRPPLLSLSDLVPPLVCPSPPPGPSTRTGKSSGAKSLPASAEPSSSGSLSSQVRLPPSSTCPPPSKSHVSITPNALVSSVCPSSSSLTFVVPLSSSFSSSNVLDPVPTCLIGSRSQSTSEPLGPPLVIAPTNYRLLHQFLDNQNPPPPLFVSSSLQVSPLSCVPPASEPPPFRASTTSGSDSIRINILSKSQLMSESEPLCRRWFTPGMWDIVPTVSLRSSSSAGPIASSVRRQNHKASSSSRTPSASTQVGHHVSSHTTISTSSASVQKDHPNLSQSIVQWVNVNRPEFILPTQAVPSNVMQKDTQQLHLPAPQTAAPPSSSSTVGTDSTLPPSGGAFFLAAVPQTQTPILVTDQKRSTHSRCAASDHQLLLDQNPASSPSHFNDQHQDLSLDKTTSVSKPGTAESGETRIEEDVSSPVTPDIQPTSEFTNPAEEKSPPEDHEVKPSVHPGDTQLYGGLFSPISSEDELFSKDPEESNPAEECFILKESEDIQPHGEPFSPVSSEDRLTTINPEETKPSERPEAGEFEWATSESEEMKPYSPISSVDEIITPEETRPAGRLFTEVQPATNTPDEDRVGLFPPVSSEDELSFPFTKAADLKLNISEMSDRDTEAPQSLQTRQRAFVLAHMQPRVSLMRLPVSLTDRTRLLPSFEVVLGDDDNIIHLKEPHVSNVSDEDSDVTEDFTKSGSSDSPMSVEVLSCSACLSPSASKICSMCGRGYHVDCHVPPVGPDIWSEWICSLCQDLSDPSDPYSSDRPKSLQGTGLSPLDQRRCETLLLHLKVEGCRRFSELDLWSDVVLISERLTHHRPPPYQTAAQLVSDLWTLFLDSSQSEELEKLQQSFLKKLKETLGAELPASLLVAPTSDKASGEGPSCSVSGTEMPREQGDFKDVRKRLRDFLGLKFSSASKRTKKH
nr:uncharacterized protein trim33l isoform X1 [Nothobranchius furzeri]